MVPYLGLMPLTRRALGDLADLRGASRLRLFRLVNGLTLRQLAEGVGVSLTMAEVWEKGRKRNGRLRRICPNPEHLRLLADLLGVEPRELFPKESRNGR